MRTDFRKTAFVISIIAALFVSTLGCQEATTGPSLEHREAIEAASKWFQYYRSQHRGKAPKDEETLTAFIDKTLSGRSYEVQSAEEILTSTRDGEKYVVMYGKAAGKSKNIDVNVAMHEQVGVGGKKLVGFESATSREVDDAELQSLLAGEEK